jgi:hypothetical protein
MYIFLGTDTNRGGVGPVLLRYDKSTDAVQNLGRCSIKTVRTTGAQGRVVFQRDPTEQALYIRRRRHTVAPVRHLHAPLRFDTGHRPRGVSAAIHLSLQRTYLTQPHSSDDDRVHSASVQDSNWQRIGCVVKRPSGFLYYSTPAVWRSTSATSTSLAAG